MSDDTALGPLDVILLEFPEGASTAPVAAAREAVLDRGIVRLFDLAGVGEDADGTVTRLEPADGASDLGGRVGGCGTYRGRPRGREREHSGPGAARCARPRRGRALDLVP